MSDRGYTRDEEERIARALREAAPTPSGSDAAGADPGPAEPVRAGSVACPRCAAPLETLDVPPRSGVAYVRDRLWLTCPGCGRRVVFDKRRLER